MKRAGFTLLELMIAVTLLSVIMFLIAGAARLGHRSVASGERKIDEMERRRVFLSVLDAQVQSLVPLTYDNQGTKTAYFRGDKGSLTFATNYSLWGGERGFVVATYRVEAQGGGKAVLYLAEHTVGIENRMETKVIENFDEIHFEYAQKGPTDERPSWTETAVVDQTIPDRIRVSLTKSGRTFSFVVPVRVTGQTARMPASPSDAAVGREPK